MDGRGVRGARVDKRWWAVPVVGLALLAGCSSSPAAAPNTVMVVGDSVALMEQSVLTPMLAPPHHVVYVARYRSSLAPFTSATTNGIASSGVPGAIIVNVGTDEASRPRPHPTTVPTLQPLMDAVSGVSCVVLTTISLGADERSQTTVALRLNNEMKRLAIAEPRRIKVVDWENFLVTLPKAKLSTYLRSDRIHPTAAGAQWLATADVSGIRMCGKVAQPTVIATIGH